MEDFIMNPIVSYSQNVSINQDKKEDHNKGFVCPTQQKLERK